MTKARNNLKPVPADTSLNSMERNAYMGLDARSREIQKEVLDPLNADFREVLGVIEDRLGLDQGAIGQTHMVDAKTWTVREITEEDKQQAQQAG